MSIDLTINRNTMINGDFSATVIDFNGERKTEWTPVNIDRGNEDNGSYSFYRSNSGEDLVLASGDTIWNYVRDDATLYSDVNETIEYTTISPFTTSNSLDSSGRFLNGSFTPSVEWDWFLADSASIIWAITVEMAVELVSPTITDYPLLISFIFDSGTGILKTILNATICPFNGIQHIYFTNFMSPNTAPYKWYVYINNPNGGSVTLKTHKGKVALHRFGQAGLTTGKTL